MHPEKMQNVCLRACHISTSLQPHWWLSHGQSYISDKAHEEIWLPLIGEFGDCQTQNLEGIWLNKVKSRRSWRMPLSAMLTTAGTVDFSAWLCWSLPGWVRVWDLAFGSWITQTLLRRPRSLYINLQKNVLKRSSSGKVRFLVFGVLLAPLALILCPQEAGGVVLWEGFQLGKCSHLFADVTCSNVLNTCVSFHPSPHAPVSLATCQAETEPSSLSFSPRHQPFCHICPTV